MIPLEDIVKGCRSYNKTHQRLLYIKYASQMRCICFRYVRNQSDIEDLIHDGFIKVFMKIKQYSGKGSFEGWMKKIFINTVFQYNIKQKKRKSLFFNKDYKFFENETDWNYSENYSYRDQKNETSAFYANEHEVYNIRDLTEFEILETIRRIPENLRIVFYFYCYEGFSHKEISEILHINVVTSRKRLMKARYFIRKELNNLCSLRISSKFAEQQNIVEKIEMI